MTKLRAIILLSSWLVAGVMANAQSFIGDLALTPASSSLVVSGNLNGPLGATNYAQQAAGSLTTTYTGNINVFINLSLNTIQFNNTTLATANNSGSWAPLSGGAAGNALANYGVHIPYASNTIPIDAALRSLSFTITSSPLTLSGAGSSRTFTPVQSYLTNTGILDYRASLGSGTSSMVGDTGNNVSASTGTLTIGGGNSFQLSFPIDITIVEAFTVTGFGNFTATSRFLGSFLSTGTLSPVPEPTTYALIGISLASAGYIAHRRRKQASRMAEQSLRSTRL